MTTTMPTHTTDAGAQLVPSAQVDPGRDANVFLHRVMVHDVFERERPAHVGIRDGRGVLIMPPGGSGVLTGRDARELARALNDIADRLGDNSTEPARVGPLAVPSGATGGIALAGQLPGMPGPVGLGRA